MFSGFHNNTILCREMGGEKGGRPPPGKLGAQEERACTF